jgi:hypothetical protein
LHVAIEGCLSSRAGPFLRGLEVTASEDGTGLKTVGYGSLLVIVRNPLIVGGQRDRSSA